MELRILEQRPNPLLKRIEYRFEVTHAEAATPSLEEVRSELAKQLKLPKDRLVVEGMQARFGAPQSRGEALGYQSSEALLAVSREHILIRNKLKEKAAPETAAAPSAPAPAAAKPPAEAKTDAKVEPASKTDKPARAEVPPKPEPTEKADKPAAAEKPAKGERHERGEKAEKGERSEKPEKHEKPEKAEKHAKPSKGEKKE